MLRLLLPFLLLVITSASHAQKSSWVAEEWQINRWTVENSASDLIFASVNGMISNDDRLRLAFRPSEKCKNTLLFTSFRTKTQAEDITTLKGIKITLEVPYDGELPVTISHVIPFGNDNYVALVSFVNMDATNMRLMMNNMKSGLEELEVTIKPTETFNAEKYFNAPTNRWSLDGSIEAFDRARKLCEWMIQDAAV
jgi:hypothetical protein